MPEISVIIAVYNNARALELIFLSLLNQTFGNFEVIVADDGSGPDIGRLIMRWSGRFAFPVEHAWHEHQGFRKTIIVNEAACIARSALLVFIDGDCILHHRFLERHWRRRMPGRVLSGRRVMMIEELSARVQNEDVRSRAIEKRPFWWNGCSASTRQYGLYLPALFGLKNIMRRRYEILGSNFSLHKSDFLAINGYDERIIGRGIEDNNLCNRFKVAGIEIKSIKHEALQYHLFHRSDPMPHDAATVAALGKPAEAWTPFGIVKGGKTS